MGSRLSPETLPDEILLQESVVVLREKLLSRSDGCRVCSVSSESGLMELKSKLTDPPTKLVSDRHDPSLCQNLRLLNLGRGGHRRRA